MRRLLVVVVVFSMLMLGAGSAVAATEVELAASLSGSHSFPGAHGRSEYDRNGTNRDVEVTVLGITRLAGHRVTVFVAGKKVGTMLVSPAGTAHRDWETQRGQFVPFASAGSTVKVRTASGTLVASGTYHRQAED